MKVYTTHEISDIVDALKEGEVIAVPTDTVYGLCASIEVHESQEKLRDIKHRPKDKAFPIMFANLKQIESLCEISDVDRIIIQEYMPGPITLVLKKKEEVDGYINGGMDTIAIRMATSKELESIIMESGPVYMTSANLSGEKVCQTPEEIWNSCKGIAGILEGDIKFQQASTIVDCTNNYAVVRKGPITQEDIDKVIREKRQ